MSLVFLVGSEPQLSEGLPWVSRFAAESRLTATVLVIGMERKTLLEHARSAVSSLTCVTGVDAVEESREMVAKELRDRDCQIAMMVDDHDDDRFQAELFENIPFKTVWLNTQGRPPEDHDSIFEFDALFRTSVQQTSLQLLGVAPSLRLIAERDARGVDKSDAKIASRQWKELAERLESSRADPGDLIWIPFDVVPAIDVRYKAARHLLDSSKKGSVILVSGSESFAESIGSRIRHWATYVAEPMDRESRIELSKSLTEGSQPNLEFLGLISASAMLAAFGLLQDSAAVIIGAMLIAPLMTPILGAGLALTHGNRPLFRSSILCIAIGFIGAFVSSFLFGCLVRLGPTPEITPEMWARCRPSPLDFCVGLVGGMAASYARTRSHLSSALAGAAIAAALVPPIATAGLELSFGVWQPTQKGWPVVGPMILVSVNVLAIMIGSSWVLWARGMRIERSRGKSATGVLAVASARERWATRMSVLIVTLLVLALAWMIHI